MGIRKIQVGVDLSEASAKALRRAVALAEAWEATLVVTHVLREAPYEGAAEQSELVEIMEKIEAKASEGLQQWATPLVQGRVEVELEIQTGVPYHQLLRSCQERRSDLLVVGHRGHTLLERVFAGSVAETVAKKSPLPVWVETGDGPPEISTILLPTDLSGFSREGILFGLDWARRLGSRVILLHVVEEDFIPSFSLIDPKDYLMKMREIGKKNFDAFVQGLPLEGLNFELSLEQGEPHEEIEKKAREKRVSLISLSSHGRSGLAYKLLGSIATKLLHHPPCPVLISRPKALDFSWLQKELGLT